METACLEPPGRYLRSMHKLAGRLPSPRTTLRLGLALFVLVWIFGPYELRSAVPIWLPFLAALGLEVHFFLGALRPPRAESRDPGPQTADRERYGYPDEAEELLLVREGDEELWIPYSGESSDELTALIAEARERPPEEPPAPAVPSRARPSPWPAVARFLVGLAVIGALALVFWVVEGRTGWNALDAQTRTQAEARFSAEAGRVAGKPVSIRCDESGNFVGAVQHADGVAAVGGDVAYLTPERCLALYRLAFKDQVRSSQTARAIAVLAHEAWHLRGVRDEGTTECYALQSGVDVGRRLGLSEGSARRLMRQQLVESTLRGRTSPDYMLPEGCRNGGGLDLRPDAAGFP